MFSGVMMAFFSHTGNICWIFLHAGIAECKPCYTPVDTNPKVADADGLPVPDATEFRNIRH